MAFRASQNSAGVEIIVVVMRCRGVQAFPDGYQRLPVATTSLYNLDSHFWKGLFVHKSYLDLLLMSAPETEDRMGNGI